VLRSVTVHSKPDLVDLKNGIEECGLLIPVGSLTAHSTPHRTGGMRLPHKCAFARSFSATPLGTPLLLVWKVLFHVGNIEYQDALKDKLFSGGSIEVSGRLNAAMSFASTAQGPYLTIDRVLIYDSRSTLDMLHEDHPSAVI